MAKNKAPKPQQQEPAPESKGLGAQIVESIGNAVDKVLHPEHAAENGESAPQGDEKSQAEKDAEATHASEPESETGPAVEMQDHPKFDKFNGGIS